jgi:hypothetical protein
VLTWAFARQRRAKPAELCALRDALHGWRLEAPIVRSEKPTGDHAFCRGSERDHVVRVMRSRGELSTCYWPAVRPRRPLTTYGSGSHTASEWVPMRFDVPACSSIPDWSRGRAELPDIGTYVPRPQRAPVRPRAAPTARGHRPLCRSRRLDVPGQLRAPAWICLSSTLAH